MTEPLSAEEVERFWSHVEKTETCWLWTAKTSDGYGLMRLRGRMVLVHRLAYELLVGPIPERLQLDHVRERGCDHRNCVNPAHLEPVTSRENSLRGDTVNARHAATTHCPSGHEYTEENTYCYPGGKRECRECHRARGRRAYAAKVGKA